ncbi:hypothetical protein B9Z55_023411 [Caenorhabditis nigoni]|uniref:BTB domain-containing protein n=1 Tax=Caenorhabditis nigoni TaxID=1611254 RepID=A0A2G5SPJ7_9PELO|nr:hypothetical protein B9Z55_023411 [Caenorhabditis nigoni]
MKLPLFVAQPRSLFEEVLSPFRNKGALRKKMRGVRRRQQTPFTSDNARTANHGRNSRVDAIAEVPQNLTNYDESNQSLKRRLDEVTERLQSLEESVSKTRKIENEEVSTESTNNKVKESSSNSVVSKPIQKEEKRFVLKYVLNDVEKFVEGELHRSVKENHFNVDSFIAVQRLDGHLSVFFHIRGPKNEKDIKWAVETKGELIIYGKNRKRKVMSIDHRHETSYGWGSDKFLKFNDVKNEYLINGSLSVEAHIQIMETSGLEREKIRTFDESQKEVSDFVVSVRDTKFHVQKMFLAAQSAVFRASLLGNFAESKKTEMTLNGIDPADFHYFLEVLYGEDAVDESTVEGIALLADMYDAPSAIRRCESFLINESKKSLKKKLQMASRYHLEDLKNKCIKNIKSIGQLQSVLPANINDLDHDVMGKLLQKSISLQ